MNRSKEAFLLSIFMMLASWLPAFAQGKARPVAAKASSAPLFADRIVAKGKGFTVKQSEVDEMYLAFKGHRAAMGQAIPDALRPKIESDILDKLIATRLFLLRATTKDKTNAHAIAESFIAEQKKQVPSEESFQRQLTAVGMTTNEFNSQIHEQAIVKAVIDREVKAGKTVSDQEARKFYNENPSYFQEPEMVRVSHILISTADPITGAPLSAEARLQKLQRAEKILARARAGEDFTKLVREFTEDPHSKDRAGEYIFPRAKDDPRRAMVPEFEAASFTMALNQISDLVETRYGFHIIKLLGKVPAKKVDYAAVESRIKETLLRDKVDKELPAFIEKLRKEAGVEILNQENPR